MEGPPARFEIRGMIRTPTVEILIATSNAGKIREIQEALQSLPLKFRYLNEFPDVLVVDEAGQTYEENAVLKAVGYANQTGLCALADDSGLEVDVLEGKPGVFSARFGGEHASDRDRVDKLLSALSLPTIQERTARFVCCMALAGWQLKDTRRRRTPEPQLLTLTKARCEGVIAPIARGRNGFGFDPVFVPDGYQQTFAELPDAVKGKISHRAKALLLMRTFLERWLAQT
jgi:XTP/dITP diphosphohydrolase